MELIEAKINAIKNLNLIYSYNVDAAIKNNHKYIGTKIVYENNKVLSLDYKDKNFSLFIKKIIDVYNKEKDEKEIILLGKLTKDLIKNSFFQKEQTKEFHQNKGLPYFNATDKNLDFYLEYLKEIISLILPLYKNYEVIDINSIKGYNHKYIVDFNIASLNKKMPIIISLRDNYLDFKITKFENTNINLNGSITSSNGKVISTFENDNKDLKGSIIYDAKENKVERKIISKEENIFFNTNKSILSKEDLNIIDFYLNISNIPILKNILKTSDNTYLLTEEKSLNDNKDEVLLENKHIEIKLAKDKVNIKSILNNGFSKYKNQIQVKLDEKRTDITIRKIDNYNNLLVEKCNTINNKKSYSYKIIKSNNVTNLTKEFDILEEININKNLNTLDNVYQYMKTKKKEDDNNV